MEDALISIIVPVYNVERYLDSCIESIVSQTYGNLEIILVNDGSTDDCGLICDKWSERDSRITVIHKENSGIADVRNVGVDASKGDYIVFVDSDDTVHPDYVEYLFTNLIENKAEIGICEFRMMTEEGKEINRFSGNGEILVLNQEQALYEMCLEKLFTCSVWAKIFSRNVFYGVRFPSGQIFEDLATTYKLFLNANKIVVGKRVLYNYYVHKGSIMTSSFSWKRMYGITCVEELFDTVTAAWPGLTGVCSRRVYVEYVNIMKSLYLSGNRENKAQLAFDELFRNAKKTRREAMKNGLTTKMFCYALASYLGKKLFKIAIRVEDFLYRNLKLK